MTMAPNQAGRDGGTPTVQANGAGGECPDLEQLAGYVDGTLDAAARREVEAHVAHCNHCLELLGETAVAVAATSETVPLRGPSAVVVDTPPKPLPMRAASRRVMVWGSMAATAAVLILAVRLLTLPPMPATEPVAPVGRPDLLVVDERTTPGRLSASPYAPFQSVTRSGGTSPGGPRSADNPQLLEAARRAQDLAARDPRPASQHAWGVAQVQIRDWDGAIRTLEEVAAVQPEDARLASDLAAAYLGRGASEARTKDLSKALALADRALQIDPSSDEASFNRAVALDALGQSADAEAAFRTVLQRDRSPWRQEAARRLASPASP